MGDSMSKTMNTTDMNGYEWDNFSPMWSQEVLDELDRLASLDIFPDNLREFVEKFEGR